MAKNAEFDAEGIFKQFKTDDERIVYMINGNAT